jgi:hypothetical protein
MYSNIHIFRLQNYTYLCHNCLPEGLEGEMIPLSALTVASAVAVFTGIKEDGGFSMIGFGVGVVLRILI